MLTCSIPPFAIDRAACIILHLFIVKKLDVNLIKVDVARGDLCCCQGKTFSVNQIDRLFTRLQVTLILKIDNFKFE